MSISLKVVSVAFVFCDAFRFLAIVYLILFIGTLVSVLEPEIFVGAAPATDLTAGGAYLGAAEACTGACTLGASACFGASAYLAGAAGVGGAY